MCQIQYIGTQPRRFKWFQHHFVMTKIPRDLNLFYRGQVPNVATLIIAGSFVVRGKVLEMIDVSEPTLIGVEELLDRSPVRCDIIVKAGSKLALFDRITYSRLSKKTL